LVLLRNQKKILFDHDFKFTFQCVLQRHADFCLLCWYNENRNTKGDRKFYNSRDANYSYFPNLKKRRNMSITIYTIKTNHDLFFSYSYRSTIQNHPIMLHLTSNFIS
jgi:hypothetical protein